MTNYYLEKEDHYWLKILMDSFFLLISFFAVYYLKRGTFLLEPNFVKFLPILFTIWFLCTILSKKFMKKEDGNFFDDLNSFVYAFLSLVGILSLSLYLLGWYYLSRFIVYGSTVAFLILEIIYLFLCNFLSSKNKRVDNAKLLTYPTFFFMECILIVSIFLIMHYYKKDTFILAENHEILLMSIYFSWLFISLVIHKFKIERKESYFQTIMPFLKSEAVLFLSISFVIYFLKLSGFSRLLILGSIGIFSLFEISIVSLFYIYNKKDTTDENIWNSFSSEVVEEISIENEIPTQQYMIPGSSVKTCSVQVKLKDVFLANFKNIYNFLQSTIHLKNIDILDALIFQTSNPYNIESIQNNSLFFLMNLKEINNFRRINQYFIEVNKKLKQGGVFISKFESLEQRRSRIFQTGSVISKILYVIDFIYKRIFPKLPFFKKIYFAISKGRHRAVSKTEALGRLVFCGFEIIALNEYEGYTYFITKKIHEPLSGEVPSYGLLFKQKRVGMDGKVVWIYKLRTMHPFAEYLHGYIYMNNQLCKQGKIRDDYRITSWGRFFRKYWIDELPMLFNWLKGDIKLIGVRPLSLTFYETYPDDLKKERIKYRPGLIPPYYADLPQSIEKVWSSEREYLQKYRSHPVKTDFIYFFKALKNILFRNAISA